MDILEASITVEKARISSIENSTNRPHDEHWHLSAVFTRVEYLFGGECGCIKIIQLDFSIHLKCINVADEDCIQMRLACANLHRARHEH